jgi:deazaflavin-dependent oxidoreductase (nitroreductase family)
MPRVLTRMHRTIYRATRGRVLGRMGPQPVLLLTTTGRRSGRPRTTPVQYLRSGDSLVLVAANGGSARPPAWYGNLRANDRVSVQLGAASFARRARVADGPERERLWTQLTAANRWLEKTQRRAGRALPVVVLDP